MLAGALLGMGAVGEEGAKPGRRWARLPTQGARLSIRTTSGTWPMPSRPGPQQALPCSSIAGRSKEELDRACRRRHPGRQLDPPGGSSSRRAPRPPDRLRFSERSSDSGCPIGLRASAISPGAAVRSLDLAFRRGTGVPAHPVLRPRFHLNREAAKRPSGHDARTIRVTHRMEAVAKPGRAQPPKESQMLWVGLGIVYFLLLVTLGIVSIRKGHWVMFLLGIVFPVFWLIGALMAPRARPRPARAPTRTQMPAIIESGPRLLTSPHASRVSTAAPQQEREQERERRLTRIRSGELTDAKRKPIPGRAHPAQDPLRVRYPSGGPSPLRRVRAPPRSSLAPSSGERLPARARPRARRLREDQCARRMGR